MTTEVRDREFSADEEAYLWAVARRSQLEFRLSDHALRHLLDSGMVHMHHDWPTITPRARRYLESRATELWRDVIDNNV